MTIKILIVDDEPAIGKLLLYQLQSCNYQASYTPNGLNALEQLEREQPDLVLLDVMMPIINGWEVCRQIRAASSVPVIMLTAKSSEADIVIGLAAGADDYIAKPFSMAQLQARIEAVLRRARSRQRTRSPLALELSAPTLLVPQRNPQTAMLAPIAAASTMPDTQPRLPAPDVPALSPPDDRVQLGPQLHALRLARGITLVQAAWACNTRWEFLQAIEQDNHGYVPHAQLRRALQNYSRYLGVPTERAEVEKPPRLRQPRVLQIVTVVTLMLLLVAVGAYFL